MQPSPILFLTGDAAERQATFEARELERRRVIAEAKREAAATCVIDAPMRARASAIASARWATSLAARRRGATGTGL